MTLVEPASSLTDFALGILALFAAVRLSTRESADSHWRWFFVWIGVVGIWGGFHHGFVAAHETAAAVSWSAISLVVAVAISYLLVVSVSSVLGKGRGRPLLVIRAVSLAVFFLMVVSGNATIATLLLAEGVSMSIVFALWLRAWQKEQLGSGLVLAAIFLSLLAAALKLSGAQFTLGGWEFDPNSIYHVAQMPGIYLMLIAVQRRANGMPDSPFGLMAAWRRRPDQAYHCLRNRLPASWNHRVFRQVIGPSVVPLPGREVRRARVAHNDHSAGVTT